MQLIAGVYPVPSRLAMDTRLILLLSAILCVSINCGSGQNNWIMQDIYRKIYFILVI